MLYGPVAVYKTNGSASLLHVVTYNY